MIPLIPIVVVLAVVVIAVAAYVLSQGLVGGPPKQKATPNLAIEDEEGTQVKIVGHRLVRLQGGIKVGNEFPITSVVTIGSANTANFTVADPSVAAVHATVRLEGGRVVVEDAGSGTGTVVNDERVGALTPKPLKDGDTIKLGATTLLYKSGN